MELYSQLLLKLQWRLKEDNDYKGGQKKRNGNKADPAKKKVWPKHFFTLQIHAK